MVPQEIIDHLAKGKKMTVVNLSTLANVVTAVCAVLITVKVW